MAGTVGPYVAQLLKQFGLESLSAWASNLIVNNATPEEIEVEIYKRPEFKSRFAGLFAREAAGYPPISVSEYIAYENSMHQIGRNFGITFTKAQVDSWIADNKSAAEMETRIGIASRVVFSTDAEFRAQLEERYGITAGNLVNFWLDPKQTLPTLERKFTQAQIAASGARAGYDEQLAENQLARLYDAGITAENATEAFGELVNAEELFEAVDETEQDVGVDEQLGLILGDQDVTQRIARRGERRAARFEEGGGFATGETGISGLGSAST